MSIEQTMHQTLQELGHAFHTFKQVNDERLDALENKTSFDGLQEDKINRLQEAMDQTQNRLAQLQQITKQRPTIDASEHKSIARDSHYKEAFLSYICCGAEEGVRRAEQKSFNSSSDGEGGYWMPQSMIQNLYSVLVEDSLLRGLTDMKEIKKGRGLDVILDSKNYKVSWEHDRLRAPSKEDDYIPQLKKIHIPLCTMAQSPKVSQALLEEGAVHIETWLMEDTRQNMMFAENEAFLWGDPTKHQPEGMLFHAKKEGSKMPCHDVKKELPTDVTQATQVLLSMTSQLPTYFLRDAVWLGSKEAMRWARSIKTDQGYLFWVPTKLDEPTSLMGRAFIVTDLMDKGNKANELPLVFGNVKRGYQSIYREGIRVMRDPYTYKPHVELYITSHIGGAVIYPEAFCTLKISA